MIGGWLSHMAISAREHGTTMIIGVAGLEVINSGTSVRLHLDGSIEIVDPVIAPLRRSRTAH